MGGWDAEAARAYHEATKHSYESVRRRGRGLDWQNRPHPFKEYVGLESEPSPPALERLLRLGAGVTRTRRFAGGEVYHFRSYASAGALYPVEVYAALPRGLFHFHPRELALRRLRVEDVRGALAEAAAEPALAEAGAVLVLTGILWRTAWKYGARGYRHLWWDAGTMLANLLAVAASDGLEPRLLTGFVDADVNRVVGADGRREAALALLAAGRGASAGPAGELSPLELDVAPLSRVEVRYPEAEAVHAASSLAGAADVRRYRESITPLEPRWPWPEPLDEVIRRRGSVRAFASEPVPLAALDRIVAYAAAPVAADMPASSELYAIVNAVDELEPGVYRFAAPDRWDLLRAGSFRRDARFLLLEQPLGALAAATIFLLADLDDVLRARGNRGYRAAQLEAGIRAGRLYLGAFAEALGATGSTFYDDDVTAFLAPGSALAPMLAVALGSRP